MKLAEIGIENIRLDDFPEFVRSASVEDGELSAVERNLGILLTLDQGSRCLCKGVNTRYIYDFFEHITTHTVKFIVSRGMAHLDDWEAAGIDRNQAITRSLAMLSTLVHSEKTEDHEWYLHLTEQLRKEYEKLTRTHDPYLETLSQDLEDIHLYGRLLAGGPPEGKNIRMHDFVYWLMRYYTSHIAYMRHFGRSPFRNVAVGRDDAEGEVEWLRSVGVERTEEDEEARELIKDDVQNGRWRPLEL